MKVLAVDDDAATRRLLGRLLRDRGHEVTLCADAEQAWETLKTGNYPLVILDWLLPGADGLTLCRRLRTLPGGDRSVIIMITARNAPQDLHVVLAASADDYIAKPFDIESLKIRIVIAERRVQDIAERWRLERELLDVSERERERIGQDLHDTLGQSLTGIAYLCRALRSRLAARDLPGAEDAAKIEQLMNGALRNARSLAKGLCPAELTGGDIGVALRELAESTHSLFGTVCAVDLDESVAIADHRVAAQLYRIAQEAIHNAAKHASPVNIHVKLGIRDGFTVLEIRDDGKGLVPRHSAPPGLGLRIMRHRAGLIGASLAVDPVASGGTCVRCTLPREGHESLQEETRHDNGTDRKAV
jgi:signal transduction histidine kinase